MKKSLETLMDEHRHIERLCRVLAAMAEKAGKNGSCEAGDWRDALDFIKGFADKCHHGKEEDQLFVMLGRRGLPTEIGPIGVMLEDHKLGRSYVKGMSEALEKIAGGDTKAVKDLAENARGYTSLLPQHIWKEDNILYKMADEMLSAEDDAELMKRYGEHEHKDIGHGRHEAYLRKLNELSEKYGEVVIPIEEAMSHAACMGCH